MEILKLPKQVQGLFQSESLSLEIPQRKRKHLQVYSQQEASVRFLICIMKVKSLAWENDHGRSPIWGGGKKNGQYFLKPHNFNQSFQATHIMRLKSPPPTTPLKPQTVTRSSCSSICPKYPFAKWQSSGVRKKTHTQKKEPNHYLAYMRKSLLTLWESSWKGRKQGYVRPSPPHSLALKQQSKSRDRLYFPNNSQARRKMWRSKNCPHHLSVLGQKRAQNLEWIQKNEALSLQ